MSWKMFCQVALLIMLVGIVLYMVIPKYYTYFYEDNTYCKINRNTGEVIRLKRPDVKRVNKDLSLLKD